MKSIIASTMSLIIFILSASVAAHQTTIELVSDVGHTINVWKNKNRIPGVAVNLYIKGMPHSYYFGYANQEQQIPVSKKTVFELGDLSQLFTTLLLGEELNSGKMRLDDPIANYIPDLANANSYLRAISIGNLATHISGLPYSVPGNIKSRIQLQSFLAKWIPDSAIGSQWIYSNMGMGLLGYALEASTHQNLNQLYRNRILQPLGMSPIAITVPQKYKVNLAQGYDQNNRAVPYSEVGLFPAATALKASSQDMLIFLKAAIDLEGLPPDISSAMCTTQKVYVVTADLKQGLGWIMPQTSNNIAMGPIPAKQFKQNKWHSPQNLLMEKVGSTNGFTAYIAAIPNQKTGIVILANRNVANNEIIQIGRSILLQLSSKLMDKVQT